jgi:hypothetical protein
MAAYVPVQRSITYRQGFSFNERVVVFDKTSGQIRDLTGYSPRMVINPSTGAQIVITTSNGLTVTPLAGQIDIAIADDLTATWSFPTGDYSLGIDNGQPNGHDLLMYGTITGRIVPT